MRLYSQTDLERCARLALRYAAATDHDVLPDHEAAIHRAVGNVVDETPPVYEKAVVLAIAQRAIELASPSRAFDEIVSRR